MSYNKSIFQVSPAVEVAYDLSLVAALLRAASVNASDKICHGYGTEFRNLLTQDVAGENWKDRVRLNDAFYDKSLAAPRTLQQEKAVKKTSEDPLWNIRHIPITPKLAQRTNFVRHADNLWDIPKRVALMVRKGCEGHEAYARLMGLVAGEGESQDLLQFFIDAKIASMHPTSPIAGPRDVEEDMPKADAEVLKLFYPYSKAMVSNIELMCTDWRPKLVSTHFALLLDSLLRLHAFMEVRHLVKITARFILMLESSQRNGFGYSAAEVRDFLKVPAVEVGDDLGSEVRQLANSHERSLRFLEYLEAESVEIAQNSQSLDAMSAWTLRVANRQDTGFLKAWDHVQADAESGELDRSIKSSSRIDNFTEFMTYSIQKRQMNTGRDGQYDQSYWASKSGAYKAAPWNFSVSPVGSILFAGLAARRLATCSFSEIRNEMTNSGLRLGSEGEVQLHDHLKGLGLAIDSPDGAGGFLVSNPFHVN
jgi:hypothetical protein